MDPRKGIRSLIPSRKFNLELERNVQPKKDFIILRNNSKPLTEKTIFLPNCLSV